MNKIAASILAFGLLFAATAGAAKNGYTLSKTPQTTARKAALGAAAYTFNPAYKGGLYNTSNIKITKVYDNKGDTQKFQVTSSNDARQRTVTVEKIGYRKWAGYLPTTKSKVSSATNLK